MNISVISKKITSSLKQVINSIPFSFSIELYGFQLIHSPNLSRKKLNLNVSEYLTKRSYLPIDNINFSKIYSSNKCCIKPSAEPILTSYIPWVTNSNCILFINHFFAQNYGIRTPLIIQASIIDSSGKIFYSEAIVLQAYRSKIIALQSNLVDDTPNNAFIYIQCYNPSIKRDHGGHQGYYRMHGFYEKKYKESESFSVVHSMPYPINSFSIKKTRDAYQSPRGVIPIQNKKTNNLSYFNHSIYEQRKDLPSVSNMFGFERVIKPLKSFGFIVNQNLQSNTVSGVWHDGPIIKSPHISDMKKPTLVNRSTATYVPRYELNAPFLFFDPLSLGFTEPCDVSIFFEGNHGVTIKKFAYKGLAQFVDTSTLLSPLNHSGPMKIRLEFLKIQKGFDSPLMVNVIFRDGMKLLGDCNHTSSGFTNIQPSNTNRRAMAIWGPYFKVNKSTQKLIWEYSLHNVFSMDKSEKSMPVKIRINTDTGFEYVINAGCLEAESIFIASCSFLDSISNFKSHTKNTATIQFECQGSSLQGSFYVLDPKNGLCGTDHLTGG
jgi:hypothetical protein